MISSEPGQRFATSKVLWGMKSPTVLVVEDEGLVRDASVQQLTDAGYRVLEAESAEQAISILEAGAAVAVLFTDVNMPGELDGLDLARVVHQRWPAVRLIVTSGGGRVAPKDVPTDGRFLAKPYRLSQLTTLVEELAASQAPDESSHD
jgi:two-component system, response regulator PdtaR